jgi:hypothetical protein
MIHLRTIEIAEDGRISENDYSVIEKWWKARASEAPPRNILPTLGVIASHEDTPLAAAFAYLDATGSGVALLAWMITDPDAHTQRVGRALKKSIDFLHLECARLNYWLAWSTIANPSLVSYLEHDGYQSAESGLTHLFKPLPALKQDVPGETPTL